MRCFFFFIPIKCLFLCCSWETMTQSGPVFDWRVCVLVVLWNWGEQRLDLSLNWLSADTVVLFSQQIMHYNFNNEQVWDIFMSYMFLFSFLFFYLKTFLWCDSVRQYAQRVTCSIISLHNDKRYKCVFIKPCQDYSAFLFLNLLVVCALRWSQSKG